MTHGSGLRTVLITTTGSGPSTGVTPVVNTLLQSEHCVAGIVECAGRKAKARSILFRLAQACYGLIRKKQLSLEALSAEQGIPCYHMNQGSNEDLEHWIKQLHPEVIVVYFAPILRENIFTIPSHGAINLHPALLPKYRGSNPFFWMYYNMETEGSVTVHFVDAGVDTGDIIYQETYPVPLGMREPEMLKLAVDEIGTRLILKALDAISAGKCPRTAQPKNNPTIMARSIKPDEHRHLIDWENWPIERVWHILRGSESWLNTIAPLPGWKKNFRWVIGQYCREPVSGVPGKFAKDKNGYYAIHPEGKIRLSVNYDWKRFIRKLCMGNNN